MMSDSTPRQRPLPDRLARLDSLHLDKGAHLSFDDGHCALEVVAWLAGEEHSDYPQCTSAVVGDFIRYWNDDLPGEDRDRLLKPLLPRLVGSAGDSDTEFTRSYLAFDWLYRVYTPAWLDLVESLKPHAAKLRGLGEITNLEWPSPPAIRLLVLRYRVNAAQPMINAARVAVRAAAEVAAGDAAEVAAGIAARNAARAAAGIAAEIVAGDAAEDAAEDAARDAARIAARAAAGIAAEIVAEIPAEIAAEIPAGAAAGDAAWDALTPTVLTLQDSARDLVCRMLAVGESA